MRLLLFAAAYLVAGSAQLTLIDNTANITNTSFSGTTVGGFCATIKYGYIFTVSAGTTYYLSRLDTSFYSTTSAFSTAVNFTVEIWDAVSNAPTSLLSSYCTVGFVGSSTSTGSTFTSLFLPSSLAIVGTGGRIAVTYSIQVRDLCEPSYTKLMVLSGQRNM
jgi:hypothetical protein